MDPRFIHCKINFSEVIEEDALGAKDLEWFAKRLNEVSALMKLPSKRHRHSNSVTVLE